MIKNIIFDLGNVIVTFNPVKAAANYVHDDEDLEIISKEFLFSKEWLLLDRGTITEEEAIKSVLNRIPERLHAPLMLYMDNWHKHLTPIPGMYEFIKELKYNGYNIYLCSNASLRFHQYKGDIPALQFFNGLMISADIKYVKPEREIYETLCNKFDIKPEESFFIDDLLVNVEGAIEYGMEGFRFDLDVEDLQKAMNKAGIRTHN